MRFQLSIDLGNDMMYSSLHVGDTLEQVAKHLQKTDYPLDIPLGPRAIKDANGNTVGHWSVSEDE